MRLDSAEMGLRMNCVEGFPVGSGLEDTFLDPANLPVLGAQGLVQNMAVVQSARDVYRGAYDDPGVPFHDRRVDAGLRPQQLNGLLGSDVEGVLVVEDIMHDAWRSGCNDIYRVRYGGQETNQIEVGV